MDLNNKSAYPEICFEILEELKCELPDYLTYHSVAHTIDVANVCDYYIEQYKIEKPIGDLIRIAAVGHDYGYLYAPDNHEERSIAELTPKLEDDFTRKEINLIAGMIRATKIPQNPQNFYEQILADADLDYLGRKDYDKWSALLFKEFIHFEVVKNKTEWLDIQIRFLTNHHFHTDLAIEKRADRKKEKLVELQKLKNLSDSSV